MAHPLPLSYNWRTPVLFASVGAIVCLGALARTRVTGWIPVALIVLALWAGFVGLVYLRTRAYLMVDGPTVTVRRYRGLHTVPADRLTAVSEFLTPHGPCYRLTVSDPDGRTARYVAPVALLQGGHSTLFAWILARAPHAELDKGSRRTLERLRIKGLVP